MLRRLLVVAVAGLAVAAGSTTTAQGSAPPSAQASVQNGTSVGLVAPACKTGYYKNVDGICVHRPGSSPKGATAKCRDGTYSYSRHASGTCSHHGGVLRWIHHP